MTTLSLAPPSVIKFKPRQVLALLAAVGLVLCSVMALMPVSGYVTDTLSHFVYQYLIASLFLCLGMRLAQCPPSWTLLPVVALLLNLLQVYPLFPAHSEAILSSSVSLKVVQANTYTDNTDTAPFAAFISAERPDVIFLAEPNVAFKVLAEGMKSIYPYQAFRHKAGILSKFPLEKVAFDDRGMRIQPLIFEVEVKGQRVTLATFHASTPPLKLAERDAEFADMRVLFQKTWGGRKVRNFIFAGDINATPYCHAFKKLAAGMDVRNARVGKGIFGSYPDWLPPFLRLPIDHVLISDGIDVVDYHLGPDIASDHAPSVMTLAIQAL